MKLYYIQGSPFARMVRVVLRELQLECEEVEVTEFPPPAGYFKINPLGQVPVLEHGRLRLFPTSVIIQYLMFDVAALRPSGHAGPLVSSLRLDGHRWEDLQLLTVLLALGDMLAAEKYQEWSGLRPTGRNVLGFIPAERNQERIAQALDWLESRASSAGFLSDGHSVQDIVFACLILWTESRGPIDWRGRPRLESLVERCHARPSFVATAPQLWQPDQ